MVYVSGLAECAQDVHGIMQEAEGHEEIRGQGLGAIVGNRLSQIVAFRKDY